MTNVKRAEMIIAVVTANGSDPRDLRDAAHEACHALDWGVPEGEWDREGIHHRMPCSPAYAAASEILARAVEQMVCARLGVECDTVEKWAMTACLEAIKGRLPFPDIDAVIDGIRNEMHHGEDAAEMTNRILALADEARL